MKCDHNFKERYSQRGKFVYQKCEKCGMSYDFYQYMMTRNDPLEVTKRKWGDFI